MKRAFKLRSCRSEDQQFVVDLFHRLLKDYVKVSAGNDFNESVFQRSVEEKVQTLDFKVIVVDETDVGALLLLEEQDRIIIKDIMISREYQNRGLGTQIIQNVIKSAQTRGKLTSLRVLKVNPAKKLYERLCFRIVHSDHAYIYMEHP